MHGFCYISNIIMSPVRAVSCTVGSPLGGWWVSEYTTTVTRIKVGKEGRTQEGKGAHR